MPRGEGALKWTQNIPNTGIGLKIWKTYFKKEAKFSYIVLRL